MHDGWHTTHDNGRKQIAIGHPIYSLPRWPKNPKGFLEPVNYSDNFLQQ